MGELYDEAIRLDPRYVAAVANRTAAHLKCEDYDEAVKDATFVIERTRSTLPEPLYLKALLRRATALGAKKTTEKARKKEDLEMALNDLIALLKHQPNHPSATLLQTKMQAALREIS